MQTNPNYIDAKDVFEATNGGLDIILHVYPQAAGSDTDHRKKFKIRTEGTASANLHKATDGNWLVTDFGDDSIPRNGIQCYERENNVDWLTALRECAALFKVFSNAAPEQLIRSEYSERDAGPDEKDGEYTWNVREDGLQDIDIETIVSKNVLKHVGWKSGDTRKAAQALELIKKTFSEYRWNALVSYSLVKDRKVKTFAATDRYPIFLIDEGTHKKLYQPFAEKKYRFMYFGEKPKDFIHGLAQLERIYKKRLKDEMDKREEDKEDNDRQAVTDESGSEHENDGISKNTKDAAKIKEVILCSGGSDAINIALMGYWVLWLNSETAKLPGYQYREIMTCAEKLYQLQDIDGTGKSAAHELAMKYLDLYTITLPEDLKKRRDRRGGECKDARDYFNHYEKKDFTKLVTLSMPYRFWEKKPVYEGRGEERKFVGHRYDFKNTRANNFLMKNGFGRYKIGNTDSDWIYVKRTGNIVREVNADMIQDYIHDFLEDRGMEEDLRDSMITTSKLNASTLTRLKLVEIEFEDFTPKSQFYFFNNKTVEVTKDEITYHKTGIVERYIWDDDMIPHRVEEIKEPPFTITKDENGVYDIEIHDKDSLFLKYLIQVSRIHWREELEQGLKWQAMDPEQQLEYKTKYHAVIDGPNLSEAQIKDQKLHLVNKIFTLGYMLFRYKDPTRPWFPYAMDGKLSEDGRSHGGSGKSIMMSHAIGQFLRTRWLLNGRNREILEDRFKYDGITKRCRYVYIDDAHEYTKLPDFYVDTSEDLSAPQKGKSTLVIPFKNSPKFAFSSNFPPKDNANSTVRRIILNVFSDYYHNTGEDDDYLEHRDPKTDLGCTLFVGFEPDEYNRFFNVMLRCIQFYLSVDEKITPEMDNVNKRKNLADMGQTGFKDWATAYFSPGGGHTDIYVVRDYAFDSYKTVTKDKCTSHTFLSRLEAYCKYYGYTLNPRRYRDKKGKSILQKTRPYHKDAKTGAWILTVGPDNLPVKKETKELLYVQTREDFPDNPHVGFPEEAEKPEKPELSEFPESDNDKPTINF